MSHKKVLELHARHLSDSKDIAAVVGLEDRLDEQPLIGAINLVVQLLQDFQIGAAIATVRICVCRHG